MNLEKSPILVSVNWLNKNIYNTNLIILDATINKTINASSERIPNARFFDIKQKFSDTSAPFPSTIPSKTQFQTEARALGIKKNSILVVYDDKGIYSSARAWYLFKVFGFKNVVVLNGGLPEWKTHQFLVENYKNESYSKGDFIASFNSELILNFETLKPYLVNRNKLIIDARSSERFKCLVDEPRKGLRRGTIPNSVNLPYTELFDGFKMKPKDQLSKIFNTLVANNSRIIFSCGSGITACILALAVDILGYKNYAVYDGSWTEYGTLTN